MLSIWIAKVTLILGIAAIVVIRTPHGKQRSRQKVSKSERGQLKLALLALAWAGSVILPVLWIVTPLFSFADYPLQAIPFFAGVIVFSVGLWLFYRSHADLATNWSLSLEIFENHHLVNTGVYRRVRHPMYAAIFLQGIGQVLIAPNWIVGPCNLCVFTLMFFLRVGPEERMMQQRFGTGYESYMKTSKRLVPGVW